MLIMLIGSSCSQDEDPIDVLADTNDGAFTATSPIFTFTASDDAYVIQAGVFDFYMFSDFNRDDSEVYTFIGKFSKLSTCTNNCLEELSISIRDLENSEITSGVQIEESLGVGQYVIGNSADLSFSEVLIEYTNEDGMIFRSNAVDQNVESLFEITSVSDFARNENDQATVKLEVNFNCVLGNIDNVLADIEFNNAKATIAVAYPD